MDVARHRVAASGPCYARCVTKRVRTILTERIPSDEHRKRRACTDYNHSTELPAAQSVLCNRSPKLRSGRLPKVVHHKVLGYVEITQSVPASSVEEHQAGERIGVRVPDQSTRTGIKAFAPGITALNLKSVAHPFCEPRLKAMINGAVIPPECANPTHIGVEPRTTADWVRPEIPGGGQGRQDHITVIGAER